MSDQDINAMGGPAFPVSIPGCGDNGWHGMTLRDYFAGQALIYLNNRKDMQIRDADHIGILAYEVADSMLKARARAAIPTTDRGGS